MSFPRTYAAIERKILRKVVETRMARAIVRKGLGAFPEGAVAAGTGGEWFWAMLLNMPPVAGNGSSIELDFSRMVHEGGLTFDLPNARFVVQQAAAYRFGLATYITVRPYTLSAAFNLDLIVEHPDGTVEGSVLASDKFIDQGAGVGESLLLNGTMIRYLGTGAVARAVLRAYSPDATAGLLQTSGALTWFQGELVRPGGEPTIIE